LVTLIHVPDFRSKGAVALPSDAYLSLKPVIQPTYITLTPSGAVDWSELLRKYLKHNTSSSEAELVAAQTRLELAIWQAVDRRDQKRSHGTVLRRRQERALRSGTSNKGKETATDIHDDAATDEWVVTDRKDSQAIRESLAEMQDLHAKLPSGGPYAVSYVEFTLFHGLTYTIRPAVIPW
jgi:hypothetical protein